ncbi:MAG TPA: cytochrome c oxidase subunit II [Methylovirgula sp.]|nr:cytochrome c oxidase subunit II [Methylovirgula sp.]
MNAINRDTRRASRALAPLAFGILSLFALPARAAPPLTYMIGDGPKAYPVVSLTWGLLIISLIVITIMTVLVCLGAVHRRSPRGDLSIEAVPLLHGGAGLRWVGFGVVITGIVLFGSLIWTMAVLARVSNPPAGKSPLTIEITGQQWWWKARYLSADPSKVLTTADEFHIPVGQPVRVKLIGADVIHNFWVPALTGKMQAIPGKINETWLEASKPGRYRGQCTEYCGWQHAHMAFFVVADPPDVFQAWLTKQLEPAAPASAQDQHGQQLFQQHCGLCHTVRGTLAGGTVAPDLTHVMSRETLAAGTLPNTPGNLVGWVANPQSIKPGNNMPDLFLSGPDLTDITTYLRTLK